MCNDGDLSTMGTPNYYKYVNWDRLVIERERGESCC